MLYPDYQTNKVYFSNLLQTNYLHFANELFGILDKHNINYELILGTKDIWMRDYMPIQRTDESYIRYIHKPDYLVGYASIRTTPKEASRFIDQKKVIDIELNLDGGNIVRHSNKIISTDKIFKANSNFSKQEVINILKSAFDIVDVIIIPEQPFDMTGHSDGLVRFIDEKRVIISPYKKEDREFEKELIASLIKHDIEIVTLPPRGYFKEQDGSELIPYMNYMQVGKLLILPVVGTKVDVEVVSFFKECFPTCKIECIDATQIIEQGGALNCISWNTYDEDSDVKICKPVMCEFNKKFTDIFTQEEISMIIKKAMCYSPDSVVIYTEKYFFELSADISKELDIYCEENKISPNGDYNGKIISKEEFMKLYASSQQLEVECLTIDE